MFKICTLNESSSEAESDTEQNQVEIKEAQEAQLLQHRLVAAARGEQQGWGQDQLAGDNRLQLVAAR